MSAYGVGTATFANEKASAAVKASPAVTATGTDKDAAAQAAADAVAPTREDGLAAIVKWVPGEVIGAYTALVAALQPGGHHHKLVGTAGAWLAVFCVGGAMMTWLGGAIAFRKTEPTDPMPGTKRLELFVRGALAAAGLLLWSYVIPGSATNLSSYVNPAAMPIVIPLAAVIFGLVAEYVLMPASLAAIEKFLG